MKAKGGTPAYVRHCQQYGDQRLWSRYLSDKLASVRQWQCTDLKQHYGCVNALEFADDGQQIISGGDDRRVLLWNVEKALSNAGTPVAMTEQHNSNIFCLAFTKGNTKILSGGNDNQVILHDVERREALDVFQHEGAVYCLSGHPEMEHVFASAGDNGCALIYDLRKPTTDPFELVCRAENPMHSLMFNPVDPQYIATINAGEGPSLWDIRQNRQPVEKYVYSQMRGGAYSGMSVRFNAYGNQLLAIGRKMPPVLYDVSRSKPLHCFDAVGYYNACTIKSCCFAGDKDQYIVSGSDNFRVYIWKVPDFSSLENRWISTPFSVLIGHRSIVNQVRYNGNGRCLLISSGVEKVIKAWSPSGLQTSAEDRDVNPCASNRERKVYTHEEYIDLVLRSGHFVAHDYSDQSVNEDPRMIAFFDSLVQRELEDNSSASESSHSSTESLLHDVASSPSSSTSPSLLGSDSLDEDDDAIYYHHHTRSRSGQNGRYSPFTRAFFSRVIAPRTSESGTGTSSAATDRTMSDLIEAKRAAYIRSFSGMRGEAHDPTDVGNAGSSSSGGAAALPEPAPQRHGGRVVRRLRRIRARLVNDLSSSPSTSASSARDSDDDADSSGSSSSGDAETNDASGCFAEVTGREISVREAPDGGDQPGEHFRGSRRTATRRRTAAARGAGSSPSHSVASKRRRIVHQAQHSRGPDAADDHQVSDASDDGADRVAHASLPRLPSTSVGSDSVASVGDSELREANGDVASSSGSLSSPCDCVAAVENGELRGMMAPLPTMGVSTDAVATLVDSMPSGGLDEGDNEAERRAATTFRKHAPSSGKPRHYRSREDAVE